MDLQLGQCPWHYSVSDANEQVQARARPTEVLHHIFQHTITICLRSFQFLDHSYGLLGIWAVQYAAGVCCALQTGLLLRQGSVSSSWLHSDQLQVQRGSHQLTLKHRVCCAECVHRANCRTQTGRQDANGGGGRPVGARCLVLLKLALIIGTHKVTGTQLHRRLLWKSETCIDICK